MIFTVLQKQVRFFFFGDIILIFEKLRSIGPVQRKIKMVWPYCCFENRFFRAYTTKK